MKKIKVSVYTVEELKELFPDGYERALSDYRSGRELAEWIIDDMVGSAKGCLKFFGAELKDYSIDIDTPPRSDWKIDHDVNESMTGVRLWKYIQNNWHGAPPYGFLPSGMWLDDSFLEPFRNFMKKPCQYTNFSDLLDSAMHKLLYAAHEEFLNLMSEQSFIENAEANDYQFFEDGELL